jgi:hypothetical protein
VSTGQLSQRWGIEFKFNSFEEFLAAVGPKPKPHSKYRFDRINPNGHYEVRNVRWVTTSITVVNRRLLKNNTSGFRGVHRRKESKNWRVFVGRHSLGSFATAEEAARAYDAKAIELWDAEAKLNFPLLPVQSEGGADVAAAV